MAPLNNIESDTDNGLNGLENIFVRDEYPEDWDGTDFGGGDGGGGGVDIIRNNKEPGRGKWQEGDGDDDDDIPFKWTKPPGGDDNSKPDWEWWVPTRNGEYVPMLKVSPRGYLWRGFGNYLLLGKRTCMIPPMLVYVKHDATHYHAICVLCRLSDRKRKLKMHTKLVLPDAEDPKFAELECIGDFSWGEPGTFKIYSRWQYGHYNYNQIYEMRFVIYGVDLGWRTMPLSSWAVAAEITITEKFEVYVNRIKGKIDGNLPYLELDDADDNRDT